MNVNVGIQLYSVRDALKRDPMATIERLADLGFTRLEGANHEALIDDGIGFGIAPDLLNRVMNDRGASLVGCHINPLDLDRLPHVLDFHASIGNQGIGCDIEFYPYGDVDYVKRRADTFNEIGRLCAERGMTFYHHNHFQEFQRFGATTVYDLLLTHTDPDLVGFEMDTYWVYRGGEDAVEWLRAHPARFVLLHQKDFPGDAGEPLNLFESAVPRDAQITMDIFQQVVRPTAFTEVGTGTLPIQQIIDTAATLPNMRRVLLEQDYSAHDELESVAISREAFARYRGVEW